MACSAQPSSITGGTILTSAPYTDQAVAVYTCNSGYVMSGTSYVTCNTGTWSTPLPSCSLESSNTVTSNDSNTYTFASDFPTWVVYMLVTVMAVLAVLLITCLLICCLQLFGCYRAGGLFGEPDCCCRQRRSERQGTYRTRQCTQFPRRYEYDENGRRFHYDDLGRRCYYEHRNRALQTSAVSPDVESSVSETKNNPPARTMFTNAVTDVMGDKNRHTAKELNDWKPHANPVRNINTSTR